jgi:hypothetical protein
VETMLLHCSRCDEIYGCTEPGKKECSLCSDHGCPVLPALRRQKGFCASCRANQPLRRSTLVRRILSALSEVFPGVQGQAPLQPLGSAGAGALLSTKPARSARVSEATSWGGLPHWLDG